MITKASKMANEKKGDAPPPPVAGKKTGTSLGIGLTLVGAADYRNSLMEQQHFRPEGPAGGSPVPLRV